MSGAALARTRAEELAEGWIRWLWRARAGPATSQPLEAVEAGAGASGDGMGR
jgi:hypothetical protein